jgi:hypothetical protein
LLEATKALFLFACPSSGFHVQDILNTMSAELEAAGKDPISDDKAAALVRRLGEGNFRNELASYPDVVLNKKVYSFVETRKTETVTRQVWCSRCNILKEQACLVANKVRLQVRACPPEWGSSHGGRIELGHSRTPECN